MLEKFEMYQVQNLQVILGGEIKTKVDTEPDLE